MGTSCGVEKITRDTRGGPGRESTTTLDAAEGRVVTALAPGSPDEASASSRSPGLFAYLLDALYLGGLLVTAPYMACLGKGSHFVDHVRRQKRDVPKREGEGPCIWVHGVSVGEVLSAREFLRQFSDEFPDWEVILSTTTRAGIEAGRKLYPDGRIVSYPFDMSFLVKRAFDRIRPSLVVIVEHELWPNFLRHAESRSIPVVIVNGRLSERSLRGYRWLSRLMTWPPRGVVQICAEDETSARGFRELGVDSSRVRVTGNIKFDNALAASPYERSALGLAAEDWVVVAASTHGTEEEAVIESFGQLRSERAGARLVLAPRRVERAAEIRRLLERHGLRSVLWSGIAATTRREVARRHGDGTGGGCKSTAPRLASDEVLVVDTVGELHGICGAADVVFVGGSLVPFGGHNLIEPASLGRAVLVGPHHGNFRQVVESFRANDAVVVVRDDGDLLLQLRHLRDHPERALELGERAAATVARNLGASRRTFDAVRTLIRDSAARPGRAAAGPR